MVAGRSDGRVGEGWAGVRWEDWRDYDAIRRRLDQGADPERWGGGSPLHRAAAFGSPEVVAELARRVADVDALEDGTSALWEAVLAQRADNARALVAAGADPWRVFMGGWSPGRLSLAGSTPDLFDVPEEAPGLTDTERTAAEEGRRLVAALGDFTCEGTGLACVAGIDAEEAIRRLEATPVDREKLDSLLEDPYAYDMDESLQVIGVTTVPGGCVVTQPWGYAPQMPGVLRLLSAGTVCYGLYANPKSGNQGAIARDGVIEGWDLHPGGGPNPEDPPEEVLASYLYRSNAVAYACAYAGLRLTDARAVVGPADAWVELPRRDYWSH
ncbi:ankyrin repeat domain-containing protein [Streptomyces sp. TRM70350]|uniref:ankyrin repeat domain-containing protein n=1 Tax=Streptomyces sp. TRM70350 TaxID=2856165 RepID=UPI001C449AC5|nr:ankyrin repeat domain-containing protein [Streptomyces sp. TRM70350]MBV7698868.1 ankyrin repeat domain-containing protein [Streptomyces sp. TRM70350]